MEFYHNPETAEASESSQLLAEAKELQCTLDGICFASKEQAYEIAMGSADRLTASLHETGSFNLAVALEGTDIIMHNVEHDPVTGEEIITPHYVAASSHPLAARGPILGRLQGFSIIIRGPEGAHRADIGYHITLGNDRHLERIPRQFYALGPVASTKLAFDKDVRAEKALAAHVALIDHAQDTSTIRHIATIEELLSPDDPDERYESWRIQQIGESLRRFEKERGGVDLQLRDSFIDLISARLGTYPGATFMLDSARSYLLQDNKFHPTIRPVSGEWELRGIEYATLTTTATGHANYTQPGSLSAVVEIPAGTRAYYVYVPFEDLFRLGPID